MADFEGSILENKKNQMTLKSRIENPADYGLWILDSMSHLTFEFLKIKPSKSAIS
jgi:hypothetical protein